MRVYWGSHHSLFSLFFKLRTSVRKVKFHPWFWRRWTPTCSNQRWNRNQIWRSVVLVASGSPIRFWLSQGNRDASRDAVGFSDWWRRRLGPYVRFFFFFFGFKSATKKSMLKFSQETNKDYLYNRFVILLI